MLHSASDGQPVFHHLHFLDLIVRNEQRIKDTPILVLKKTRQKATYSQSETLRKGRWNESENIYQRQGTTFIMNHYQYSRATRAAIARRVKTELVELLFPSSSNVTSGSIGRRIRQGTNTGMSSSSSSSPPPTSSQLASYSYAQ